MTKDLGDPIPGIDVPASGTAKLKALVATKPTDEIVKLTLEIRTEHEAVIGSFKSGFGHAVRCGELLIAAKKIVGHGGWLPWFRSNQWISSRTASDYMRLAASRMTIESKSAESADLTIQSALRLLSSPKSQPNPTAATPTSTPASSPSARRIAEARQALHDCEPAERKAVWRSPGLMESIVDAAPQTASGGINNESGMTDGQLSAERALLIRAILPNLRAVHQQAHRLDEVESEISWRRDQKHGPTNDLTELKKRRRGLVMQGRFMEAIEDLIYVIENATSLDESGT